MSLAALARVQPVLHPDTLGRIAFIDPLQNRDWDPFVRRHPNGWICHLARWKQVLEQSYGHMEGFYPVVLDADGRIRAALPVFSVRSPLTGSRLVSIPYATLCDPLATDPDDLERLLQSIFDLAGSIHIRKIQVRTLQSPLLAGDERFWCLRFYKHHYLRLDRDPEELQRTFHRTNVRQRIRRALNSGLTVRRGKTELDLVDFYQLYVMTRKRLGLPPQPYRFFSNLWDAFLRTGEMELLLACRDGHCLSGLILFKFNGRISAEFLGSDDSALHMSPNHLLFWEAIRRGCREGYRVFDFGRTAANNESLMTFKSRWGTTLVDLPQYCYPRKHVGDHTVREKSLSFRLINRTIQRLPDRVCESLGNFLYNHLG